MIEKNCVKCSKLFSLSNRIQKYCSKECYFKSDRKQKIEKTCLTCKKTFYVLPSRNYRKMCSVQCLRPDEKTRKAVGEAGRKRNFWNNASPQEQLERLTKLFEKNVIKIDGCWGWKKKPCERGYAVLGMQRRKHKLAHRLSFEIFKGQIPEGLLVCHTCDNRSCTNPDHLFLGTSKDNYRDMVSKGRKGNLFGTGRHKNIRRS